MVYSSAQRPIDSLAQTIEKNIREGYKNPELAFIRTISGRQICLPEWSGRETRPLQDRDEKLDLETITVRVPTDLADQLRLAAQSKLWPDFDSTVADLVGKGLHLERQRIKDALLKLLDS